MIESCSEKQDAPTLKAGGDVKTKRAFVSGMVTALVIVLVIGLVGRASWFTQTASSAASAGIASGNSDAATWQSKAAQYQAELQQANAQLQAAYNEIATLQAEIGKCSTQQ
jgi:peptidoglycan hydrolase CwlO-like protein